MPLEAPPGALSHFLLAGCLWFSSSSLLLWLWLLLAFARPLLPLLPLISYTTCPLPLCVVIAPFFLAFISFFFSQKPAGLQTWSRLGGCACAPAQPPEAHRDLKRKKGDQRHRPAGRLPEAGKILTAPIGYGHRNSNGLSRRVHAEVKAF